MDKEDLKNMVSDWALYVAPIESLGFWQKMEVWCDYLASTVALRNDYSVFVVGTSGYSINPLKRLGMNGEIGIEPSLNNGIPLSFSEFVSIDRVKVEDMGGNWKERWYAQKYHSNYSGIYWWYFVHKSRFNFVN